MVYVDLDFILRVCERGGCGLLRRREVKKCELVRICDYVESALFWIVNCQLSIVNSMVYLLLLQLTVAAHEAVYATCCVNERALTCIERVRGV